MNSERQHWADLLRLLDSALDLEEAAREPWLQTLASPQQEDLRKLLAQRAEIETADFLARPAALPRMPPADDQDTVVAAHSGQRIGPWRLLREIGRGGMAWVWLAERADGQGQRQVALKLPRLGWAPGLAERMARERDILATLAHPHIAPLYDAGVDDQGRPWLALAYVEGRPLNEHAVALGLSIDQRLALLIQVAEAVAHAHSRLVVHRDLKPANILVTPAGQVQLLDFGIAKLLQEGSADATALTRASGRAMTLDYASPEQVRGQPLTTATDIYSLGVVAFELLSGQRPYRLQRRTAAELEEAITALDSPLASSVAEPALRPALRGDLDAVLAQALERDPARRYATVAALADDLRRHLAGHAVSARAPGPLEQLLRFVRRHRVGVSAGIAVAGALLAGAALALWQAREAQGQRDLAVASAARAATQAERAEAQTRRADAERLRADTERGAALAAAEQAELQARKAEAAAAAERRAAQLARQESQRAAAVQDFLVDIFKTSSSRQADPQKARSVTARELLDIGAGKLDGALASQPTARLQLSDTLSRLYGEMSLNERSVQLARSSVALAEKLHGRGSDRHVSALALLLTEMRPTAGDTTLQSTLAEAEAVLSAGGRSGPRKPSAERADLLLSLAMFSEGNQLPRARRLAQQAAQEAAAIRNAPLQAQALLLQGRVAARLGDHATAVTLIGEGLRRADALAGGRAQGKLPERVLLAESQMQLLRVAEALEAMQAAMAEAERKEGPDHIDALQTRMRLGAALGTTGRHDEAIQTLQPLAARVRGLGPARELLLSLVLSDLGWNLRERGDFEAADAVLSEALAIRERLRPGSNISASLREELAGTLIPRGRFAEATMLLDSAEAIRLANGARAGEFGAVRLALLRLQLARARGDAAAARALAQTLVAGRQDEPAPTRGWFGASLARARVLLDDGELAAAATHLRFTAAAFERLAAPGSYPAIEAPLHLLCGRLARRGGQSDEGQRSFARADALTAGHLPDSPLRQELAQARIEAPASTGPGLLSCGSGF